MVFKIEIIKYTSILIFGGVLFQYIRKRYNKFRIKRRFKKADIAEQKAVKLALKNGYKVLDIQKEKVIYFDVDGDRRKVTVRADLLLKKYGRIYVGEVKTGNKAIDPENSSTRRQLLEYYLAYQADSLLLFDMETKNIHRIEFLYQEFKNNLLKNGLIILGVFILGLLLEHYFDVMDFALNYIKKYW